MEKNKNMKKIYYLIIILFLALNIQAQTPLSLDECHRLALKHNKELLISEKRINSAHFINKSSKANFLPKVSATGAYSHTSKAISLLNSTQKVSLNNIGTTLGSSISTTLQKLAESNQNLAPLISSLSNVNISDPLNQLGGKIVDGFKTDSRNMYVGAVSILQPIYMGNKIRAYNKITSYAEKIAGEKYNTQLQTVILNTDIAYWQVISLVNKKKLSLSYLKLLKEMNRNLELMIKEGVATKADGLTVSVKLNEAELLLTKVEDALSLSRMLLCQICGLDLNSDIELKDEKIDNLSIPKNSTKFNMYDVFLARPEIKSLNLASKIYKQKIITTRAEYLPSLAFTGNYLISNPSVFNGYEKKFKGMFTAGLVLNIPICNWHKGYNLTQSAKMEYDIANLELLDAKEKIELQVNQSAFKVKEAAKRLKMALKNMDKAEENLRIANIGFKEGIIPTSNVIEAQTAWLSAQSDKIDAQIDIKLTETYFKKAIGTLK